MWKLFTALNRAREKEKIPIRQPSSIINEMWGQKSIRIQTCSAYRIYFCSAQNLVKKSNRGQQVAMSLPFGKIKILLARSWRPHFVTISKNECENGWMTVLVIIPISERIISSRTFTRHF